MRMLRKLLRDRKGITMTEVVVAMATVILVTGAAISLLISSIRFDAKYDSQTRALNACESAISCVRFADNQTELATYLGALGFDIEQEPDPNGQWVCPFADGQVTVEVSDSSWVVTFDNEKVYEKNVSKD